MGFRPSNLICCSTQYTPFHCFVGIHAFKTWKNNKQTLKQASLCVCKRSECYIWKRNMLTALYMTTSGFKQGSQFPCLIFLSFLVGFSFMHSIILINSFKSPTWPSVTAILWYAAISGNIWQSSWISPMVNSYNFSTMNMME